MRTVATLSVAAGVHSHGNGYPRKDKAPHGCNFIVFSNNSFGFITAFVYKNMLCFDVLSADLRVQYSWWLCFRKSVTCVL